jgi:hypothetical protein
VNRAALRSAKQSGSFCNLRLTTPG